MQDRLKALEEILEISRRLATGTELDQILEMIIQQAAELLDCEWATVFLHDGETKELYVHAALGGFQIRFPADQGVAGAAAASDKPVVVQDAYTDPRFFRGADRESGQRTRNLLACRLLDYQGELAGVLEVGNKRDGAFQPEDSELLVLLAAQAGVALQRARLIEAALEHGRMERELQVARNIQQELLPEKLPDIAGYELRELYRPAEHVGGDLYDLFPLEDGRWGILVGDATGHGVGAALMGAQARSLIRGIALVEPDLGGVIQAANRLLGEDLPMDKFVTLLFGILEPETGLLRYISAGQAPLLHYRAGPDRVEVLDATGIPMGLIGGFQYPEPEQLSLEPGDLFAVLTDGFYEARSATGEEFSLRRVTDWLTACPAQGLEAELEALYQANRAFESGQQADDLTALVIRRLPEAFSRGQSGS